MTKSSIIKQEKNEERKMNSRDELFSKIHSVKQKITLLKEKRIDRTQSMRTQLDTLGNEINDIFLFAQNNKLSRDLLNDFISDQKNWLVPIKDFSSATVLLPHLEECACCGSDYFNRFKNNNRQQAEDLIISDITQRFPDPSTNVINYLSFGGGQLLQDFIIVSKLMLLSYKMNINLVDPSHCKYSCEGETITPERYLKIVNDEDVLQENEISVIKSKALLQFESLSSMASEMGNPVVIHAFLSMDDFKRKCTMQQDLIAAIDIDDFYKGAFNDGIKAQLSLHENGKMFLANYDGNSIFSKNICLQSPSIPQSANKNQEYLPLRAGQSLRISVLNSEKMMLVIHSLVIPYIQKQMDVNDITLTIPEPQELNSWGQSTGYKNLHMSKEYLRHYISLFLPQKTNIQLNYVTGFEEINKLLPQFDKEQDFVIVAIKKTYGIQNLFNDLEKINRNFSGADFYCSTVVFDPKSMQRPFSADWVWNSTEQSIQDLSNTIDKESIIALHDFYTENKNPFAASNENMPDLIQSKDMQPSNINISITSQSMFKTIQSGQQ